MMVVPIGTTLNYKETERPVERIELKLEEL